MHDKTNLLQDTINHLRRLPGIGPRSARRIAYFLCESGQGLRSELAHALLEIDENIVRCEACRAMMLSNPCSLCAQHDRDARLLCVVEHMADMLSMEQTGYKGCYHCLGGVLSAHHGVYADHLQMGTLIERIQNEECHELILALPLTVDGQLTAQYLASEIRRLKPSLRITQLAHGIPAGGALDYLDEGTLLAAYRGRTRLDAD